MALDEQRSVRVRIDGEEAFLTVKGGASGPARLEFEYPIPLDDARELLTLCTGPCIDKIRRRVPHGDLVWEVDEFFGANAGLIVAEVELRSVDQAIELPAWVGQEVTDDARYYNVNLALNPYAAWR